MRRAGFIDWDWAGQYNSPSFVGGIAQLGERLHGMQEVSGSIPLTSTRIWQICSRLKIPSKNSLVPIV